MSHITQSPYEELKEKYETLLSERRSLYGYIDLLQRYGPNVLSLNQPVKKKKPKLEFFGYGIINKFSGSVKIYGNTSISTGDTHEVFVRPIVRKK